MALRDTRVVAFGETHGTREIPRLVGDYICALAVQGYPVVFAWKFEADNQPLVDAYLDSPGAPADVARLLSGRLWQAPPNRLDGRASQAGLELVERIRQLKKAGYPVSIYLFVDNHDRGLKSSRAPIDDQSREGDRAMAEMMMKALDAHPDPRTRFVIEAGGRHVATRHDVAGRAHYLPMGQRLRQAGVDIASLEPIYAGTANQFWGCEIPGYAGGPVAPEQIVCGVTAGPDAATPQDGPPIRLNAYDGTFYVGTTTASPPALRR